MTLPNYPPHDFVPSGDIDTSTQMEICGYREGEGARCGCASGSTAHIAYLRNHVETVQRWPDTEYKEAALRAIAHTASPQQPLPPVEGHLFIGPTVRGGCAFVIENFGPCGRPLADHPNGSLVSFAARAERTMGLMQQLEVLQAENRLHKQLAEDRAREIQRLNLALHVAETEHARYMRMEHFPTPIRDDIKSNILINRGTYFDFLHPEQASFTIEDIAWGLAKQCRFAGHIKGLGVIYTVAQHCVLVSLTVPREHALPALLHDAAEFVMGDVVGPLKNLLRDYKAIEARVEPAILARFGLSYPLAPAIKEADLRVLMTEQRDLRNPPLGHTHDFAGDFPRLRSVEPLPMRIEPWTPAVAFDRFMDRYHAVVEAGYVDR
jgi:5'-nucleotidase